MPLRETLTKWGPVCVGEALPPRRYTTEKDWEKHKPRILELRASGLTLKRIREIMEEYNFGASESQYKTRLKIWNDRRNLSKRQRRYIIRHISARDNAVPRFRFEARGDLIDDARVLSVWNQRDKSEVLPETTSSPCGIAVVRSPNFPSELSPPADSADVLGYLHTSNEFFPTEENAVRDWRQARDIFPRPSSPTNMTSGGQLFELQGVAERFLNMLDITLDYEYVSTAPVVPFSDFMLSLKRISESESFTGAPAGADVWYDI